MYVKRQLNGPHHPITPPDNEAQQRNARVTTAGCPIFVYCSMCPDIWWEFLKLSRTVFQPWIILFYSNFAFADSFRLFVHSVLILDTGIITANLNEDLHLVFIHYEEDSFLLIFPPSSSPVRIFPESLRWLLATQQYGRSKWIIGRIAKKNRVNMELDADNILTGK